MDETSEDRMGESEPIDSDKPEAADTPPIKRSFIINQDSELRYTPKGPTKRKGKTVFIIIVLIVILLGGGFFLNKKFHFLSRLRPSAPAATTEPTSIPIPTPTPTPQSVLNRSEWNFEVLNGSGVTGEAKKIADKIKAIGYSVVKTGNADKDNYQKTQIQVKGDLLSKVDLVIADLKDTIKIASVAGELKDSTASARIIIGKDSI